MQRHHVAPLLVPGSSKIYQELACNLGPRDTNRAPQAFKDPNRVTCLQPFKDVSETGTTVCVGIKCHLVEPRHSACQGTSKHDLGLSKLAYPGWDSHVSFTLKEVEHVCGWCALFRRNVDSMLAINRDDKVSPCY